jgi:glycosyltransferase involved in cell wall biosynthesis
MNILFICDEYPPGLNGGIGTVTQSLAREMVTQGHNVVVVGLYNYEYSGKDYEDDNGVTVSRLRFGFNFHGIKKLYNAQRKIPNNLKRILFGNRDFTKFINFLKAIIIEQKIDIIEQPDWNTFAYEIGVKYPVLPQLGVPVMLKSNGSHSYFCKELGQPQNEHFASIDKAIFARADALAAVSQHTANVNQEIFKLKTNIKVLYNSIEVTAKTEQKRTDNFVLFTGTLVKKKGVFSLMQAWNIVAKKHPDVRLVMLGKGNIENLKKLLDPEIVNTVEFMGHLPKFQLMKLLETATLSIFPSYTEAFSLAILESMSTGCPTIYSVRSSGIEVIDDGVNGFLIDPDNIEQIAEKIDLLINDEHLRTRIGIAGREVILNKFEIRDSVKKHIAFYQEVIDNYKK